MRRSRAERESQSGGSGQGMSYAEIVLALGGALLLGWAADAVTGRRGLAATTLMALTGAVCGGFLAVRVFAVSTLQELTWVGWSLAGSVICLLVFFLFRNTR
jgi:sugar phosphate permease